MANKIRLPDGWNALPLCDSFWDDFYEIDAIWTQVESDSTVSATATRSQLSIAIDGTDNNECYIHMPLPNTIGTNDCFVACARVTLPENFNSTSGQLFFGLCATSIAGANVIADSGAGTTPSGAAVALVKYGAENDLQALGRASGTTLATVLDFDFVGASTARTYDLGLQLDYSNSLGKVTYFARRVVDLSSTVTAMPSVLAEQPLRQSGAGVHPAFYAVENLGNLSAMSLQFGCKQHDGSAYTVTCDYIGWAKTR